MAAEVADLNDRVPLPLITVTASAPTAADAAKLATTTVSVLRSEITQQQAAAGTPVDQRVAVADAQERVARHAHPGPQQEHSDPRAVCHPVGQHRAGLHPEQPQRGSSPLYPSTPG